MIRWKIRMLAVGRAKHRPVLHFGLRQEPAALICSALSLVCLSPAFAQAAAQHSAPDTAAIVSRLRTGDADGALIVAKQQLAASPRDCRLLSLEGVALGDLGRTGEALHAFQHALVACPAFLPALEGAAQIDFAAGSNDSIGLLNKILAVRPEDPATHAMLATLLSRRDECALALPHFTASAALFSTQPDLLLQYGVCLSRSERWQDAVAAYQQLAREHPSETATYDLAVAQWRSGHPKDALATLEPLLAASADERVLVLGSSVAEDAGDTAQAVALLRSAILVDPDDVDSYLAFATLAYAHQSFQVGIDMIDAGLTKIPNAAPLYVARGVLYVQLSKMAEAISDFQHAHQLDPQLSFAMDAIGILQTQQHNNAASLALFRQQVQLHPKDALLQYLLAEELAEASGAELEEAIAAAKQAVALEGGYQPALDLLATLYLRADKPALADHAAQLALAHDANDESALFEEIRAKRKLGDSKDLLALTARLELARKQNQLQSAQTGRYRLSDK